MRFIVTVAALAIAAPTRAAPIQPNSAMEKTFTWTCNNGTLEGRVQRSPLKRVEIQALSFAPAKP